MKCSLAGKRALVTGAGAGLGRGIAVAMAEAGADCVAWAYRESRAEETAKLVEAHGQKSGFAGFDMTDDTLLDEHWAKAVEILGGPIDIVVHNAASMPVSRVEEMSLDSIDHCLNLNVRGAVRLAQLAVPGMRESGGGSILLMASGTAYYGMALHALYCSTKAALLGLSRGLAIELAPDKIRVNSVSPGTIDSPMLDDYVNAQIEQGVDGDALRKAFDEMHPRGQIGSIEEVANTFVFLASDAAANITGTDLRCDGGLAVKGQQASL